MDAERASRPPVVGVDRSDAGRRHRTELEATPGPEVGGDRVVDHPDAAGER